MGNLNTLFCRRELYRRTDCPSNVKVSEIAEEDQPKAFKEFRQIGIGFLARIAARRLASSAGPIVSHSPATSRGLKILVSGSSILSLATFSPLPFQEFTVALRSIASHLL